MRKKSLLKKIFKRKKKRKVEPEKSSSLGKVKLAVKKHKAKSKGFLKKIFSSDKFDELKKFFLTIAGYGVIINFSFHFIFGVRFNVFTLFAWGILYFMVKEEFVEWFRRLIAKR